MQIFLYLCALIRVYDNKGANKVRKESPAEEIPR